MKRTIIAACGAVAFASGLAAQTPQPAPAQPPTQPPARNVPADPSRVTTMTGCLKPWDGTMSALGTGTTKPAGEAARTTSGAPVQFVLTDVEEGTTTPAPSPDLAHGSVVVKAAAPDVNLGQHLNHTVELTGTITTADSAMPPAGTAPDAATSPAPMGKPGKPGTMAGQSPADHLKGKMPTFTVTALKMVAATCD